MSAVLLWLQKIAYINCYRSQLPAPVAWLVARRPAELVSGLRVAGSSENFWFETTPEKANVMLFAEVSLQPKLCEL